MTHEPPAEVIYHSSPTMAEHRRDEALRALDRADVTSEIMGEIGLPMDVHEVLGASQPAIGTGRTFGPSHTRVARMRTRVSTNGTGLPITHNPTPDIPRQGLFTGLAMDHDGTGLITGLEED